MATSPFELFRRNLKPLMIALTVLAMFAFVVLPALESYLQTTRPGGPVQTTVASYEGGTFDINEIDYFNRNHNLTLRFLSALAEKTIERGGNPQVPGFALDPQTGGIRSLGINSNVSRQAAVTAKLFAGKADEMGMELDDAALRSWLDRFVDGKLSPAEINGVLATATENQLGQFHMYEQLRTHLLASAAQQVLSAGLVGGNQLTTPPAEQFELFRRLNQQAVVTAYPVLVDDFLDQVTGEPSEAEIEELYEKGKERYPDEMSSRPAFRRPATRVFEYVTADTEKLIEEEMTTISEEELRAEYEQRLEGGEFRMPQTPGEFTPPGDDPAAPGDAAPDPNGDLTTDPDAEVAPPEDAAPEEMPAEDAPVPAADDTAPTSEPADEQPTERTEDEGEIILDGATPTDETAGDETPVEEPADETTPGDEAEPTAVEGDQDGEAVEPTEEGEPAEGTDAADETEPVEETDPGEPEENAKLGRAPNPYRLVAFAPQDDAADSADEPTETAEPIEPAAEPEEPATDAAETPAEEQTAPADDEAAPATDPDIPDADADETPAPTDGTEPMQDETAEVTPGEEAAQVEEGAEPQPRPFEEVRDQIARQLATAPANEKAQAAIRQVSDAMRRYFTRKAIYDTGADKSAEPPVRPDLEALAEELGLEYGKTEQLNQFELQDHPLGNTATRGMDMQSGERFINIAFDENMPLESPIQTESMSTRQPYVSWIVAATEESIPELSEVRDEVVTYWRMQQARQLAEKAAQDLAVKANESEQPLTELVPEDRKSLVAEGIGPFPWMLWLGPGRRPIEWSVQELDRTGEEFMQQVFFQPVGEFGVAPNAPKTVYYTVKTVERTPDADELRERFLRSDERQPVVALASERIGEIQQGYFEAFQEEVGLEWADE